VFASETDRRIYVDAGTPGQSTTGVVFSSNNPRRTVGRRAGSIITNFFSGNIDEVRVYNTALSAAEISGLYMDPPTFDILITYTGTPTLYGELTPKMHEINLVIS